MPKTEKERIWKCECECGRLGYVRTYALVKGKSRQCGSCAAVARTPPTIPYNDNEIPYPLWYRICHCANKRKIPIEIDKEYITKLFFDQDKKCALSGTDLTLPKNATEASNNIGTASLDRINSELGYMTGNVQWVHKDINRMKNIFPEDYFIDICKRIANHRSTHE